MTRGQESDSAAMDARVADLMHSDRRHGSAPSTRLRPRHAQLVSASRIDSKTGLLNAATWQREAAIEITRATRKHTPVAVAILHVDHFKKVNDTYGHLAGDAVLAAIAATARALLREYDIIGRFGGEEFAIILPHTNVAEATPVTERLRAVPYAGSRPSVQSRDAMLIGQFCTSVPASGSA